MGANVQVYLSQSPADTVAYFVLRFCTHKHSCFDPKSQTGRCNESMKWSMKWTHTVDVVPLLSKADLNNMCMCGWLVFVSVEKGILCVQAMYLSVCVWLLDLELRAVCQLE